MSDKLASMRGILEDLGRGTLDLSTSSSSISAKKLGVEDILSFSAVQGNNTKASSAAAQKSRAEASRAKALNALQVASLADVIPSLRSATAEAAPKGSKKSQEETGRDSSAARSSTTVSDV